MLDREWLTGTFEENFHPCANPDCAFWVPFSNTYCCMGCDLAHQGGYEIHDAGMLGHGEWCAKRVAPEPTDDQRYLAEARARNERMPRGSRNMTSEEFLAEQERRRA